MFSPSADTSTWYRSLNLHTCLLHTCACLQAQVCVCLLMFCATENRCVSAPIVANATCSLDIESRLLTVSCVTGHRFPSGTNIASLKCNDDGTWNDIDPCQRECDVGHPPVHRAGLMDRREGLATELSTGPFYVTQSNPAH